MFMLQLIVPGDRDEALALVDQKLPAPWLCIRALPLKDVGSPETVLLAAPVHSSDERAFEDAVSGWFAATHNSWTDPKRLVWWQRFEPEQRGRYAMPERLQECGA